MSNPHQHELDPEHQHEEEDEHELAEDDVVEVVEDFGDEPMDDDDDDNEKYDGEIVIGAPQPGEEEAMEMMEDNTMGATCTLSFIFIQLWVQAENELTLFSIARERIIHFHNLTPPILPQSPTSSIRRRR